MIKRIVIFILFFIFLACSKDKEHNSLFMDTYIDVLSKEVFKFRFIRPPTPEEFNKGVTSPIKLTDTLKPLRLFVQKKHLQVKFNELRIKLPEEYKFAYDITNKTVNYFPKNIKEYSTKEYEFIEFDNLDDVFKDNKISQLNYGGILQFSKALLNKENNKALLFLRETRDQLDSVESLILLEKVNGKWEVLKSIVISFA